MMNRACIAAGVAVAGIIFIAYAQESAAITGQWIIDGIGVPDQVQLTLHRSIGKSGSSTNSSSFPVKGFLGLSRAQMDSPRGAMTRFQMVRDAGTLACEGYFKQGNGAGTFTFSQDSGFISEMRKLGYSGLNPEMLFSMAAHNVSLDYVHGLRAANAAPSSADELISMRIHGVSIEYIQELGTLGYRNLKAGELVTMRIHGVTTDFIRELNQFQPGGSQVDADRPMFYPSSQHALMEATKKRAVKLEAKGKPVDFKELLRMEPDGGTTNIRNVKSKHWTRWLGPEHRCVVPFNSFSEFNKAEGGDIWFALDETRPLACFAGIWTNWTSVRKVKEGETTNDLYAFLTTEPNAEVGAIHPKAMPVILTTPEEVETWMTAPPDEVLKLQRPLPALTVIGLALKSPRPIKSATTSAPERNDMPRACCSKLYL